MASPTCQDSGPLREWAPLTALLQKIPAKIQNRLFTQDINFTCIDVIPEFIAIGTNHGLVYWFDRKTGELETLGCENISSSITCVQIISTVDYMVAAGNNQGVATIFQIPKRLPDSLPETFKPKKKKQVERFNISGLHKATVTAVEWSKNGMKLFSGDENGLVVLTKMDFNLHLSKSTELLNEKYTVVQLSYQSGLLLISTLFRTILVNCNQNNQVAQVGQKERKTLGKFGAVFSKNKSHIQEPMIYASRPGLRIWQADKNGIVLKTLILKEAMKMEQTRVELLNPVSSISKRKSQGDPTFGIIMPLSDDLLVTYNEDVIYIVNPRTIMITSILTDLRKVIDIACSEDEIFILEGERSILRISSYPEITNFDGVKNEQINQVTPFAELNKPVTWRLEELTSKLKSSPIVPAIPFPKINPANLIQSVSILPPVIIGIDSTSIINAEEAVEIPSITPLNIDTCLVTDPDTLNKEDQSCVQDKYINRKDIFKKISEQDFEEVVFTPSKIDKKLLNKTVNNESLQEQNIVMNDSDNQTSCSKVHVNYSTSTMQNFESEFILKSEKNLETIQKAIQDKERLLSNYLNLDLSEYRDKSKIDLANTNPYYSVESNSDTNKLMHFWTADQNQQERIIPSLKLEPEETHKAELTETDLADCNTKIVKPKHAGRQSRHSQSDLDDKQISETRFNAMSKQFVKSAIFQDNDDWILLG